MSDDPQDDKHESNTQRSRGITLAHSRPEAFILAGGASSRMGQDKALLEIAGQPMLLRTARLLEPLAARVTVIGPPERYPHLGLRVVPDDTPGLGPLGGILTAVRHAETPWFLVVGCDLPYLTREWLAWLISCAGDEAAIVIPQSPLGYEPLCALYHQRCAGALADAVARGVRKVTDAFLDITMQVITETAWRQFDASGKLFENLNEPERYLAARADIESRELS